MQPVKPPDASVGIEIAKLSCQLTELASSLRFNSHEILWDFYHLENTKVMGLEAYDWPRLRYIVLNMPGLVTISYTSPVCAALVAAGAAALRMPRLKVMDLWDTDSPSAAIFQYSNKNGDDPKVIWRPFGKRIPSGLESYPTIIGAWQDVAQMHSRKHLTITSESLQLSCEEFRRSYGKCILSHLELNRLLLDPRSLHQIWFETNHGHCR